MNTASPATPNIQTRQHWMSILATAPYNELLTRWQQLQLDPPCEVIRQPEVGLARLQGRIGGSGQRFNFADTTITRAAVRLEDGTLGYGYLQGRAKQHALLAAIIDALLVQGEHAPSLQETVIQPLAEQRKQAQQHIAQRAAQSKVDFFTLVRGED